jgi:calcineurin-like phosphoesterase family protein
MTTWFTADHHFTHENIIDYTKRPFSCAEEMDEEMIRRWNLIVGQRDIIYHLGDFALANSRRVAEIAGMLHGRIHLIPGGHDRIPRIGIPGLEIEPPLLTVNVGRPIVLCHYPLLSWDRSHYGVAHFHGHSHGTLAKCTSDLCRRLDVGVDCWTFAPVSLEEALRAIGAI